MNKPLNNLNNNPIKGFYEDFWVPVFGRILHLFTAIIEGHQPKEKQTYNLRDTSEKQ